MTAAEGRYFDGVVASCREVRLTIEAASLGIEGSGFTQSVPLNNVILTEAIGSIPRSIRLPDGALCETSDRIFVAELERRLGAGSRTTLLRRWEKSLLLVGVALAGTALIIVLFLRFGIPVLARQAAFALPPAVENGMGRESLSMLDRLFTRPTGVRIARREELSALFRRIVADSGAPSGCRLEFRTGGVIGANALALPSGIVVITDELIDLARNDDEIGAIMAHELGHVRGRHALRNVLQSSTSGLVIATLTGDLVSIASLAATLPATLVEASYSRQFEREADDAALIWMKSAGVPPRRYAEVLGRLQAQLVAKHGGTTGSGKRVRNYLSTHPDTGERIRRILKTSEGSAYTFTK